jgi:hypothetical protein
MKAKERGLAVSRETPEEIGGEVPESAMGRTLNPRRTVYLRGDAGVVGSIPTLSANTYFVGVMFR